MNQGIFIPYALLELQRAMYEHLRLHSYSAPYVADSSSIAANSSKEIIYDHGSSGLTELEAIPAEEEKLSK